eukprot:3551842-Rhodomonas_salina.2
MEPRLPQHPRVAGVGSVVRGQREAEEQRAPREDDDGDKMRQLCAVEDPAVGRGARCEEPAQQDCDHSRHI